MKERGSAAVGGWLRGRRGRSRCRMGEGERGGEARRSGADDDSLIFWFGTVMAGSLARLGARSEALGQIRSNRSLCSGVTPRNKIVTYVYGRRLTTG